MFKIIKVKSPKEFVGHKDFTARQCYNVAVYYLEQKKSLAAIAKKYRCSQTKITLALKKNNISLRKRPACFFCKTPPLTDEIKQEILNHFERGHSTNYIRQILHLNEKKIIEFLVESGYIDKK